MRFQNGVRSCRVDHIAIRRAPFFISELLGGDVVGFEPSGQRIGVTRAGENDVALLHRPVRCVPIRLKCAIDRSLPSVSALENCPLLHCVAHDIRGSGALTLIQIIAAFAQCHLLYFGEIGSRGTAQIFPRQERFGTLELPAADGIGKVFNSGRDCIFRPCHCLHSDVAGNVADLCLEIAEHVEVAQGVPLVEQRTRQLLRDLFPHLLDHCVTLCLGLGIQISVGKLFADGKGLFAGEHPREALCVVRGLTDPLVISGQSLWIISEGCLELFARGVPRLLIVLLILEEIINAVELRARLARLCRFCRRARLAVVRIELL